MLEPSFKDTLQDLQPLELLGAHRQKPRFLGRSWETEKQTFPLWPYNGYAYNVYYVKLYAFIRFDDVARVPGELPPPELTPTCLEFTLTAVASYSRAHSR